MSLCSFDFTGIKFSSINNIEVISQSEKACHLNITSSSNNLWEIKLSLPDNFPYDLPSIYLASRQYIGRLRHVNSQGSVCVDNGEGYLIDYYQKDEIIKLYIEKAIEMLDKSLVAFKARNFNELYDELEGYWQDFLSESSKSYCFFEPGDSFQEIDFHIAKAQGIPNICGIGTPPGHENKYALGKEVRKYTTIKGYYIPLINCMLPPQNGDFVSWPYLFEFWQYMDDSQAQKLKDLLKLPKCAAKREIYILLSLPRPSGGKSLLGFYIKNLNQSVNPLLDKNAHVKIDMFLIQRHYPSFLKERGGAYSSFADKKIAFLGCGSVGSEIIYQCARLGVNYFLLIDSDTFDVENLFRHRLGAKYLYIKKDNKVSCIKQDLGENIPYVKIDTIRYNTIEDKDLESCQLIVSAIGNPTKNLEINRRALNLKIPCIYAWLEGISIGGHVVYICPNFNGCLECLYTQDNGISNFKYLLMQSEERIAKNLTGCAGVFVPFSHNDACQTASLATRIIGLHLENKLSQNLVHTWLGDNTKNLKVTENYANSSILGYKSAVVEKHKHCRVCYG